MILPQGWIWPHIAPEEILSPDGLRELVKGILLVQPALLDKLEIFRTYIGYPLKINHAGLFYRGYRSPKENYDVVKGEQYSFHMQGLAADISVSGISLEELRAKAVSFGWHGIGFYPEKNFIHCDLRPRLNPSAIVQWTL